MTRSMVHALQLPLLSTRLLRGDLAAENRSLIELHPGSFNSFPHSRTDAFSGSAPFLCVAGPDGTTESKIARNCTDFTQIRWKPKSFNVICSLEVKRSPAPDVHTATWVPHAHAWSIQQCWSFSAFILINIWGSTIMSHHQRCPPLILCNIALHWKWALWLSWGFGHGEVLLHYLGRPNIITMGTQDRKQS